MLDVKLNYYTPVLACLAASLFSFFDLFQLSIFNVLSTHFLDYFNLSAFMLGVFASIFLLANAIGLVIIGVLLDRYSTRTIGLIFMSLTTFSAFVFAYSSSFYLDCLLRFFQGLASAASLLICIRSTTQWFSGKANFALGMGIAIAIFGGAFGNYGFATITVEYGWQNAFIISGLIGLFILFILYLFLFDLRDFSNKLLSNYNLDNKNSFYQQIKQAMLIKQNLLGGLFLGLMSAPIFILAALWGNIYLIKTYHISMVLASILSSQFFIGMIIGAPIWGKIADTYLSQGRTLLIGAITLLFLSLVMFNVQLNPILVGCVLFGLGFFSSVQNITFVIITQNNPAPIISTASAVAGIVLNLTGAVMQPLFSWLSDMVGSLNTAGNLFFPAAFGLCIFLVFLLKKKIARGCQ